MQCCCDFIGDIIKKIFVLKLFQFNNLFYFFRTNPVELFQGETEKKEATPKLRMPYFLSQEAKGCDYIVLWLDCDKAGDTDI